MDTLLGGEGVDGFEGSAGNDILRAHDGVAEPDVDCGTGQDLAEVDATDVTTDCDVKVVDTDADGVLPPADCDDTNPAIRPGAVELPGNALDEDCDGIVAPGVDPVPSISSFSLTNRSFRVGPRPRGGRRHVPRGTSFELTLSEAARVTFTFARRVAGRRMRGRCRARTKRNRRRPRCTRFVPMGSFSRDLTAGPQSVAFSGRLGRRALPRGSFRLTVQARDGANQLSNQLAAGFKVVR